MTTTDAKTLGPGFDSLLARLRLGEEVVILEGGAPVAKLVLTAPRQSGRIFGEFEGKVRMSDDFTAPLEGADLADWEK